MQQKPKSFLKGIVQKRLNETLYATETKVIPKPYCSQAAQWAAF